MFSSVKLFVGALALIGVSGVMACDCGSGTKGTGTKPANESVSTVVGRSSDVRAVRMPAADVSYSRSVGRGTSFEFNGANVQTDAPYSSVTAGGSMNTSASNGGNFTGGSGNGRGRRE